MIGIIVMILTIVAPIACLAFYVNLNKSIYGYNQSIGGTCRDIIEFSDNLEDSLNDIGTFDRHTEEMIIRGELTCRDINYGSNSSKTAKKLNWYAHTRHYYFTDTDESADKKVGTTEDWLRRQLKSCVNE